MDHYMCSALAAAAYQEADEHYEPNDPPYHQLRAKSLYRCGEGLKLFT